MLGMCKFIYPGGYDGFLHDKRGEEEIRVMLRKSLSNRARAAFAAPMRGTRLIRSMSDVGKGSGLMNGWYLWVT